MVFFQVHDRNFGSIIFVDTSHDDGHMTDKIYQNLSRDQKADYFQNESSKRHFPLTKYVCLQLKGLSTKTNTNQISPDHEVYGIEWFVYVSMTPNSFNKKKCVSLRKYHQSSL